MTIEFLKIPIQVLQDTRLSNTQKMLLGLIVGFGKRGCSMGNPALAELLHIETTWVSKLLAELESLGLVRIVNPQSKYRRIYFGEKPKVNDDSTLEKNTPTLEKSPRYFGEKPKHIRRIGKNKGLRPSADADTRGENHAGQNDTDWDLYDQCARSLTHDADPAEVEELLRGMPQ